MTHFSKHEVINNLREKNKELKDKIEAIKTWYNNIDKAETRSEDDVVTIFMSEFRELKNILEARK